MLISHLGHDTGLACGQTYLPRFVNSARQWFLRVCGDAEMNCGHRDGRMHVIGSGYGDAVHVLLLFVQHFTPVGIPSRFGPLFGCCGKTAFADRNFRIPIAEGDHVVTLADSIDVRPALAADAHRCQVHFFIWRGIIGMQGQGCRKQPGSQGGGLPQKFTAIVSG